jgi:hypothetical protein
MASIKYKGITYSSHKNHKYFYNGLHGRYLHRDIYIEANGPIPEGYHIHHKDGDSLNNSLENLECLTPKQHCAAHSKLAKEDPSKDIYQTRREWQKSEDGVAHHSKLAKNNWEKLKQKILNCKACGCEYQKYIMSKIDNDICYPCKIRAKNRKKRIRPKKVKIKKIIPKILLNCKNCGETWDQKTSKKRLFCSSKCRHYNRLKSKIDNVARKCVMCDNDFSINRYSKTKTCSALCRSRYISLRMR